MSPEHAALIAAVVAAPADDLPRLVVADYLEESGEPEHVARAHYIRAQVAVAAAAPGSADFHDAAARADRAFAMFGDAWAFDLPRCLQDDARVTYRRGFPDAVEMPYLGFVSHAAELLAALPLAELRLTRVPGPGEPFAAPGVFDRLPGLAGITALKLGPGMAGWGRGFGTDPEDHPVLTDLMTCRTLSGLRALDLSENYLDETWAVRFAARLPAAAFADTLRELNLARNFQLSDAAANVLATAPGLANLTRLNVWGGGITPAGMRMLRTRFGSRVTG